MRRLVPRSCATSRSSACSSSGQALSVIGDRVTMVALPVRRPGGGRLGEQRRPRRRRAVPAVPDLRADRRGVADRTDRKRVLIASDAVRMACQADGRHAAGDRRRRRSGTSRCSPSPTGRPTRSSRPRSRGCCPRPWPRPATSSPPTRCAALSWSIGLGRRAGDRGPADRAGAARARRCSPTPATFTVSILCLVRLRPAVAERDAAGRAEVPGRPARRLARGALALVGVVVPAGMSVYHAIVLPSVFVLGPGAGRARISAARRGWAVDRRGVRRRARSSAT